MVQRKITYGEAMKRLEMLVNEMDSEELDIDTLSNHLKEAQKLIKYCRDRLYKTDEEIRKLLDEDETFNV